MVLLSLVPLLISGCSGDATTTTTTAATQTSTTTVTQGDKAAVYLLTVSKTGLCLWYPGELKGMTVFPPVIRWNGDRS